MKNIVTWYHNLSTFGKSLVLLAVFLLAVLAALKVAIIVNVFDDAEVAEIAVTAPPEAQEATVTPVPESCKVKGSLNATGEKIYQIPSDEFYAVTVVVPEKGERMFCAEADAIAAGWRRGTVPPPPADPCDTYKTVEDARAAGRKCDTLPSRNDKGEIGEPATEQ